MTDEELDAIEARGKDPLNFCEDARDGLEQFGADVCRLVKEIRDERAVCARWKLEARNGRTHHEGAAIIWMEREVVRRVAEVRLWRALAHSRLPPDAIDTKVTDETLAAHEAAETGLRAAGIDPDAP